MLGNWEVLSTGRKMSRALEPAMRYFASCRPRIKGPASSGVVKQIPSSSADRSVESRPVSGDSGAI